VTDANLVLGRFGGAALLGGDFELDEGRAHAALDELARQMTEAGGRRVRAVEAALGVVRVVNAGVERALRVVSVERGHDPRGFALVSFGGAGGLHACALAQSLRIPRVIVPRRPGALSALGALASDVITDTSRTVMLAATPENAPRLARTFAELERRARAALKREGFADARQRHERSVAARYRGQSFELEIKWRPDASLTAAFHRAHLARYGYAQADNTVEIVSARMRSAGLVEKLKGERLTRRADKASSAPARYAQVYFTNRPARVAVYARADLAPGARLRAPCIVTEYSSTTLVPADTQARVDQHGNLIIEF
jgi:N-methylhydantoinase A